MSRTGSELAPTLTMEQSVDVAQGELPTGAPHQLGMQLLGRQHLPLDRLLLPAPQKRGFLFQRQVGPTPTAPARPIQTLRPLVVVLTDPEPDGLFGHAEPLGDLMGGEPTDLGQPNGQAPLVAVLVRGFPNPCLQFLRR